MDVTSMLAELADLKQRKQLIAARETQITEMLATEYKTELAEKFGTVRCGEIKFHVPKRIKWNQEMLAGIFEKIQVSGSDPFEFVKVTYDVPESRYKAWPSNIRDEFEPARTVEAGKVTIKLEEEGDE
jgi:hypothetical protein